MTALGCFLPVQQNGGGMIIRKIYFPIGRYLSYQIIYIASTTKLKICTGGRVMESVRYWQDFGAVLAQVRRNERNGRGAAPGQDPAGRKGGEVVYGGRHMSLDVYLAVPTFIRRGITIVV
jgi:hypothetical protein